MKQHNTISQQEQTELLNILKHRFQNNMHRHRGIRWEQIRERLAEHPSKLWSLHQMEHTGGEPDVVVLNPASRDFFYFDCCAESPKSRRSLCYDQEALMSRKENKPSGSAVGKASDMGVELITENQYFELQKFGEFDTKTSSWIATPHVTRALGGALFGDRRYDRVFVYHNGAESYYASRGFRAFLNI